MKDTEMLQEEENLIINTINILHTDHMESHHLDYSIQYVSIMKGLVCPSDILISVKDE
jgi:hypothetical protein